MKSLLYSILAMSLPPVCAQSAAPELTPLPKDMAQQLAELQNDDIAEEVEETAAEPAAEQPQRTPEGFPIVFHEPSNAMFHRRYLPVEIDIKPSWKLTPAQMVTAMQLPRPRKNGKGYLYPEDLNPTPEQKADGSALTDNQRYLMRRARRATMDTACWEAYKAAKAFNRQYAEQLERQDKQGKHIRVNLSIQHGFYMDGDKELMNFSVCSGKKSTPTPTGHYRIIEKDKNHRSNLYNDASMPFYLRLTLDGVGMHQGPLMGYPSSHGCIRLSSTTAQHLYKNCEVGTPVFVYSDPKEAKPRPPKQQKSSKRRKRG